MQEEYHVHSAKASKPVQLVPAPVHTALLHLSTRAKAAPLVHPALAPDADLVQGVTGDGANHCERH